MGKRKKSLGRYENYRAPQLTLIILLYLCLVLGFPQLLGISVSWTVQCRPQASAGFNILVLHYSLFLEDLIKVG